MFKAESSKFWLDLIFAFWSGGQAIYALLIINCNTL